MLAKVCGMRDAENIKAISELKPDYMGFIFYDPSPRDVSETLAIASLENIPIEINKVAVFVNKEINEALHILNQFKFNTVQLHGNESPKYCQEVKNSGYQVFKVFSVDAQTDFNQMRDFQEVCDYFLFDTKSPQHGGTGQKFDWKLLQKYNLNKPVILSGGIGPEDITIVQEVISKYPWIKGLDLNSKFEQSPGVKDISKLGPFFKTLRQIA